ncbi:hypothetical protein E2F46_01785 [Luteimonas aestuarii]|uniref:Glutaconyl-CoA decarboxylase subunit gamma n=1 Tax=Luteimonas aestuarii TaxID=453837 RepID=A0A4R5U4I0_9GAMM|nr:DUF5339 family protein [Luteimonas aestuarii]TDK28637.1 hypothetical protein E2F46_01785 [Luteimonas aestuarii]
MHVSVTPSSINDKHKEKEMNKWMLVPALVVALAACKKDDTSAPADANASADNAVADTAEVAAAPVNSGLPQACEDYLSRAKACFAKANPQMAAAFQDGIDQSKAQWDAMTDRAGLEAACKMANDQFAQTASALACE